MIVNNTGSALTNGPISLSELSNSPGNKMFLSVSVVFDINDENASAFQSNGIYAASTCKNLFHDNSFSSADVFTPCHRHN